MEVFADSFLPPGPTEAWAPARHCPRCVWPRLRRVDSLDESTHWLCEACGHCWRIEHGRLRPVNVLGCQGCATQAKCECIALLQREFPRFGSQPDSGDEPR
jgi:hypothetical protein